MKRLFLFYFLIIFGSFETSWAITANQAAKLVADDGAAGDFLGQSVALSGNTAVIGAIGDSDLGVCSGSAYVFVRHGSGTWSQQAKLLANDGTEEDSFGWSVSVSGDTVVIGAPDDVSESGHQGSGTAYVFVRDGSGTWTQQAKLVPGDGYYGHDFGYSVSVSGNTVVIGMPHAMRRYTGEEVGYAYVFVRDGSGTWTQQAKLSAGDHGFDGDFLGWSVALSANTAVIGAPYANELGRANHGSAYVFVRGGSGTWSLQAKLLPEDTLPTDALFGNSVAVSDDTAVIGAVEGVTQSIGPGSAHVFVRDGSGTWTQQAKLQADDGVDGDWFGRSVALSDDTVVVGANQYPNIVNGPGSAYVFVRDGYCNWTQQDKMLADDGVVHALFGSSVALSGNTVVVGAFNDDALGEGSGSAYVFSLSLDGPMTQWAQTYGGGTLDKANSIQLTPDGGYVMAGHRVIQGISSDLWIMKVDSTGTVGWEWRYDGQNNVKDASILTIRCDQGYLVTGTLTPDGSEESDILLMRLSSNGDIVWQKRFGGEENDVAVDLTESNDGNYIVAATTQSFGAGEQDVWLIKFNPTGTLLWQKRYGGPLIEQASSIEPTRDGGYIFAAYLVARNGDFWIVKLDAAGNIEWQKSFGLDEGGNENVDSSPQVKQTEDGGYIVAGATLPVHTTSGTWVLKLDSEGSIQWQKKYTGSVHVYSLEKTHDLGYIMSGNLEPLDILEPGDGWAMKLDSSGNLEWRNRYGGDDSDKNDYLSSIRQTVDGGYIAAGLSESFGVGGGDAWVLKLDSSGMVPDCPAIEPLNGILTDTSESPVVTTSGSVDTTASVLISDIQSHFSGTLQSDGCHITIPHFINLAKTGQTTSYYTGDDGDLRPGVTWPSPRFTDNGDGTIRDELTGLVWLKDAMCARTIGHAPNGGTDGRISWGYALDFIAGINDGSYDIAACGYTGSDTDWRMPNINELASLVHAGEEYRLAWLGGQGFTNIGESTGGYWSSTTVGTSDAMVVYLTGYRLWARSFKANPNNKYVWPVRAGQRGDPDTTYPANVGRTGQTESYHSGDDGDLQTGVAWPSERFLAHGDGTVTDRLTGLMWLQDAGCFESLSWQEALETATDVNVNPSAYGCQGYTAAYDDWRLPNFREIWSLIDMSQYSPRLPVGHPFVDILNREYWTSTTAFPANTMAWTIDVRVGDTERISKTETSRAWLVRGGTTGGGSVCQKDLDGDGDVDGIDLAAYALGAILDLGGFANDFGKMGCLD